MLPSALVRRFIQPVSSVPSTSKSIYFSYLQWNVLADKLCDMGSFPHCHDPKAVEWANRKVQLASILLNQVKPDILTMQEVDHYADFFEPTLSAIGYTGIFVAKKDPEATVADGCALFYNTKVYVYYI